MGPLCSLLHSLACETDFGAKRLSFVVSTTELWQSGICSIEIGTGTIVFNSSSLRSFSETITVTDTIKVPIRLLLLVQLSPQTAR